MAVGSRAATAGTVETFRGPVPATELGPEVDLNIVVATGVHAFLEFRASSTTAPPRRSRSSTILPALREHGVTEARIDELTIGNPRRFLDRARVPA